MAGWHHRCNEYELGQTLGDGEGQGSLVHCIPWGYKSRTLLGNWTNHLSVSSFNNKWEERVSLNGIMSCIEDSFKMVISWFFFSPFHSKQSSVSGKTIFKRITDPNRAPIKWMWYRSGALPSGGLWSGIGVIFCSIIHKWVPRLWEDRYWGSNWYCEQDPVGLMGTKAFLCPPLTDYRK